MIKAVELNDLCYAVKDGGKDRKLINHISYSFEKNKITVISGASGAGKSTLLHAAAGLLPRVDAGDVRVLGTSVYTLSEKERDLFRLTHVSMIFQELNLFSFMNVKQNICVPLYAKKRKVTADVEERISYYLDLLNLGQIQGKDLCNLSGGERQRIAIVRAVIDCPEIILCDEPTANLDNENSILFLRHLRTIVDQTGITAIIVSHDMTTAQFADVQLNMADGKLV